MSSKKTKNVDKKNLQEESINDDYYLDEPEEVDEDYYLDDPEEGDDDYYLDDPKEGDDDYYLDDPEDDDPDAEDDSDEADSEDKKIDSDDEDDLDDDEYEDDSDDDEYDEDEYDEDEYEDDEDEYEDEDEEDSDDADSKVRKKFNLKKFGIAAGIFVAVLCLIYLGISIFFMSHFYYNTKINNQDFSLKKISDVQSYMKSCVTDYQLTIRELNDKSDTVLGTDISLSYQEKGEIQKILRSQDPFLWPKAFWSEFSAKTTVNVVYDQGALDQKIQNLQAVTMEQIPPTSAQPVFNGEQFVVQPEVLGTAVNMDNLNAAINQAISAFEPELDMVAAGCYQLPRFLSKSPEVVAACDALNQYLGASITYAMNEPVVVDRALISTWLSFDENLNITFHEDLVRNWLVEFGDRFDTVGAARTIVTPAGRAAEVSGGTYGWSIDEDAEFAALINSIKNGEVITKEPAYFQRAAEHSGTDWGSTYVDVDISAQHMWFVQNGAVALESDVVTGYPNGKNDTPVGVYFILEKQLNKTLVGEDDPVTGKPIYETPVSYWMRVTWSGVGFHDANWQAAFGGDLYLSPWIGSHGCINMPVGLAAALYDILPMETPVIIHY